MVISDALAEEIFQILSRLPYFTAAATIDKMRAELAMQQQVLQGDQRVKDATDAYLESDRAKKFQDALDKTRAARESVEEVRARLHEGVTLDAFTNSGEIR